MRKTKLSLPLSRRKIYKQIILSLLFITLAALTVGCSSEETYEKICQETGKALYEHTAAPAPGSVGGEWAVIGLARSDYEVEKNYFDTYLMNTEHYVKEKKGVLHTRTGYQYTEYARIILGVTAADGDVTDIGGYNFLEKLTNMEDVCRQGINGPIWTLIAYDSGSYEIPAEQSAENQTTREKLIETVLERQLADGGWSISSGTSAESDVDMTAMALQALAPYYLGKKNFAAEITEKLCLRVNSSVEAGIEFLSKQQNENGCYLSWGKGSAESSSQVVTALSSLGIDADTDPRFVKGENSALDGLLSYYDGKGCFYHTEGESAANGMASEQAYYALTAYHRFLKGCTPLYQIK